MTEHDGGTTVQVTFRLPAEAGAERAWLVGEFNGWAIDETELARRSDGVLEVTIPLEPGTYRFRYYLGEGRWENAWDAEAYAENEYGGSDSVMIVRAPAGDSDAPPPVGDVPDERAVANGAKKAATKKKAAAKKSAAKKAAAKKASAKPAGDDSPKKTRAAKSAKKGKEAGTE